ncbi:MAG TPA: glutathione S-transferase family protein [Casimicrobiaceae bacterium]|jgi:glutathione S-transferase|nr:glutathione S-transferase family protein [Casimicrobiaceae bacterium]
MIDFHTGQTSNGQRVGIVLEECGLPYRVHRYALLKGEHKTPEFEALNPAGMVPVIVDDDGPNATRVTLTQSGAIVLYLAEKAGRFLPHEMLARTRVLEWLAFTVSDVVAASAGIFLNTAILPEKSPANVKFYEERVLRFMRVADTRLAGHEWLAGDLSVADFALYPIAVVRGALIDAAGDLPNLVRWRTALGARPGVQRGMAAAD